MPNQLSEETVRDIEEALGNDRLAAAVVRFLETIRVEKGVGPSLRGLSGLLDGADHLCYSANGGDRSWVALLIIIKELFLHRAG